MRKFRRMISWIMLMVMLATLIPSGALAAETPTGETSEMAAVEEPAPASEDEDADAQTGQQEEPADEGNKEETVVTEEASGGTSVSDGGNTSEEGQNGTTASTGEASTEEEPTEPENGTTGDTGSEVAPTGETSADIAPEVEPVKKDEKGAGTQPIDLQYNNRIRNIKVERRANPSDSWTNVTADNPIKKGDALRVWITYRIEKGALDSDNDEAFYTIKNLKLVKDVIGDVTYGTKDEGASLDEPVGTLDLVNQSDKSILATLKYDHEYIKDGDAVIGQFHFVAYPDFPEPGPSTELKFLGYGDGFEINVDSFNEYDIEVQKTCNANTEGLRYRNSDGAYLTSYTLTVSSPEKGTSGVVTVKDVLECVKPKNAKQHYAASHDISTLVIKDTSGKVVPKTGYSVQASGATMTITGLPQLNPGEKYVITYDVAIQQKDKTFSEGSTTVENNGTTVKNTVTATGEKGEKSEAINELKVLPEFSKGYDTVSGKDRQKKWTVRINRNASHNMAGYTYSDTMSEGMFIVGNILIKGAEHEDVIEVGTDTNSFSYTFDASYWGDDLNKELDIIYTTDASKVEGSTYFNTGEIIIDTNDYKVTRTIGTDMSVKKAHSSYVWELGKEYTLCSKWKLSGIILPETMGVGDDKSHTYEDVLDQTLYKQNKTTKKYDIELPSENTIHYTYCSEVFNALNENILITTTDGYYKFDASSGTTCTFSNRKDGSYSSSDAITFTLTGYDKNGNAYDIVSNKNDSSTRIIKFAVNIRANKELSINNATFGGGEYTSYFYYGPENNKVVNDGSDYVGFFNELKSTKNSQWSSKDNNAWAMGIYARKSGKIVEEDGKVYIDYTAIIHYDMINLGEGTVITDQRSYKDPYGGGYGTYVVGSAKASLWIAPKNDAGERVLTKEVCPPSEMETNGYFSVDSSKDSEGTLLFNFDLSGTDDYDSKANVVKITYRVRIDDDTWWDDVDHKIKVYDNKISDDNNHSVEASVPVEKTSTVIEKNGEQKYDNGKPTGTINYSIKINEDAADLDNKNDTIVLTDTMEDNKDVSEFDDESLKLYFYNKETGEKTWVGEDYDWESDYDKLSRTLKITIKDSTAYVLEYSYIIAPENMQSGMELKNTAELMGFKDGDIPPIEEQESGSTVTKRVLDFSKVDEKNITIKLDGAKFDLEEYDSANNKWTKIGDYTTTGGRIKLDIVEYNLKEHVVYRLVETEAPSGYSNLRADGKVVSYYFVIKQENEKDESAAAFVPDGITEDVDFFNYYGGKAIITNRRIDTVTLTVNKVWNDLNNVDNTRPASIKVQLLADGKAQGTAVTIKPDKNGKFTYTWKNLKKEKDNGTLIKYTVSEVRVDGYDEPIIANPVEVKDKDGNVTGYTIEITNSLTPKTQVSVVKVWDDFNDEDKIRPQEIKVQLKADGSNVGDAVTLNEGNKWSYTWEKLDKYGTDGKTLIVYSVDEVSVPTGYQKTVTANDSKTSYTITNSHMPKLNIPVEKIWNDNNDQDGIRPTSIQVKLTADGKQVGDAITLSKANGWKYTWENQPKYNAGKEIQYAVDEVSVPAGYTKSVSGNVTGFKIRNTHGEDKIVASVTKVWDDANNQDGVRPTSVSVQLKADGVVKGEPVTLNKDNNWHYEWEGLTKNKAGKAIVYTVEEAAVAKYNDPKKDSEKDYPKYEVKTEKDNAGNVTGYVFTVTNKHTPDTTEVSVEKIWDDKNDQDRKRPAEIQVQLKADGTAKGNPVTLKEGSWTYTWKNLPKNKAEGVEIVYTVDEVKVPAGYTKKITGDAKTGYVITNSYTPGKVDVDVTKNWDDANNQDGVRPASIEVQLKADGEAKGAPVTLSAANEWYYKWSDLNEMKDGKKIDYTVDETAVPEKYEKTGVEKTVSGNTISFKITNKHTPVPTEVSVEKIWDDKKDQDGKRPATIQVQLKADGEAKGAPVTLTTEKGKDSCSYTWENLPKYKPEGIEIVYTVDEVDVPKDYSKVITGDAKTGFVIKNSYTPGKTSISVEKVWDDKDDQDGKRPESITVKLTADGGPVKDAPKTVVLNDKNSWKYTWSDLDKMAAGKDIVYTVDETAVPAEYEKTVSANGDKTSYTITNKHVPETIDIDVEKVWEDLDDMDKARPEDVTVKLLADKADAGVAAVTLSEDNDWADGWTDLARYKDGKEIVYTVAEDAVDGYTTGYEFEENTDEEGKLTGYSFTVTNTHKERPVQISKVDITSQKEVAGATLQVLDSTGKVVKEWTSTDDGKPYVVYGLTPGEKYILRETVEPLGYTIAADTEFTVDADGKVDSKGTVTEDNVLLVEDTMTKVNVRKVDAANDKELPGATLQILDKDGNVVIVKDREGNDVKCEWISTEEDHVVEGLTAGVEYTLRETVTPRGFTITSDTKFTIDNNNKVTSDGTVTKAKDGTPVLVVKDNMTVVEVSKVAITGEKELKGANIQILDSEGNIVTVKDHEGNDVKCEWVSTGEPHKVEGLEINKEYTLRETIQPDGYTIATDAKFSIDKDNNVTYSGKKNDSGVLLIEDEPTKVKVSKTDITGEKELQGATLQILDSEGNVVEIKDNDGNVVEKCEWKSGKEPKYIEGLPTGIEYTLREIIAPAGYTIASDTKFTIKTDGTVETEGTVSIGEDGVTTLVVKDDITKVKVSKTDITNDEELPGATLQILDKEGNVVEIRDNDGNVVEKLEWKSGKEPKYIEGLPTGIEYTLRETIAPDGYTIASDTKFTINEKGEVTSSGTTSTDEEGNTVLVVEDDLTHITVSKVDTGTGEELPGAKIQIIDEKGKVVEEWTSTTEPHKIDGLKTGVKYILREKVAPLGYTLTSDTTFTIDEKGNVTSTGTVNKEGMLVIEDTITEVKILKVDSKTGKGLAGAKLQVLDDNGAVCEEWESTTEAHKITGLYTGVKYTLHEVSAPKGYKVAKDVTFTMDEYGKVSGDSMKDGMVIMKDEQNPPPKNKTGDEANGALWALLLALAGGALGGTVWFKRKRKI